MASRLIGSYPNARAHDPETFTAQVVRLFLRYDAQVVTHVVETLPSEPLKAWDGLPSLADISKALDAKAFRISMDVEREQRIAQQIAERDETRRIADQQAETGTAERISAGFTGLREQLHAVSGQAEAEAEHKAKQMHRLSRANQLVLERECQHAGVDPAGGVTPMLRKLLGAA
jgi:hypothetical protein